MKWKQPCPGDVRVRSGFLWLPREADGETRWLESATWRESYGSHLLFNWSTVAWVDVPEDPFFGCIVIRSKCDPESYLVAVDGRSTYMTREQFECFRALVNSVVMDGDVDSRDPDQIALGIARQFTSDDDPQTRARLQVAVAAAIRRAAR